MSWWEDLKYKRPIAERTESVTHTPAPVSVTYTRHWLSCTCEMCGKEFRSKRRVYGTKYCSSKCRQKAYRQNKKLD